MKFQRLVTEFLIFNKLSVVLRLRASGFLRDTFGDPSRSLEEVSKQLATLLEPSPNINFVSWNDPKKDKLIG